MSTTSREWLDETLTRRFHAQCVEFLRAKVLKLADLDPNEIEDIVNDFFMCFILRDPIGRRERRPTTSEVKQWLYRHALTWMRDRATDVHNRAYLGVRIFGASRDPGTPRVYIYDEGHSEDELPLSHCIIAGNAQGMPPDVRVDYLERLRMAEGLIMTSGAKQVERLVRIFRLMVEGLDPSDISTRVGLSRNRTIALVVRVREITKDLLSRVWRDEEADDDHPVGPIEASPNLMPARPPPDKARPAPGPRAPDGADARARPAGDPVDEPRAGVGDVSVLSKSLGEVVVRGRTEGGWGRAWIVAISAADALVRGEEGEGLFRYPRESIARAVLAGDMWLEASASEKPCGPPVLVASLPWCLRRPKIAFSDTWKEVEPCQTPNRASSRGPSPRSSTTPSCTPGTSGRASSASPRTPLLGG